MYYLEYHRGFNNRLSVHHVEWSQTSIMKFYTSFYLSQQIHSNLQHNNELPDNPLLIQLTLIIRLRVKQTMQGVDSSNIGAVGYDADEQVLFVTFRSNNRHYRYSEVPPDIYTSLLEAGSIGRYFNSNIRDIYDYTEIDAIPDHILGNTVAFSDPLHAHVETEYRLLELGGGSIYIL
jgi:hypothetical protein